MIPITQLPHSAKPREKLFSNGVHSLSLEELIAVVLRTGVQGHDLFTVAHHVSETLKSFGPNVEMLTHVHGLGRAKAAEIVAACALEPALQSVSRPVLNDPQAIYQSMEDLLLEPREHLVAFFLSVRNDKLCREIVSIGTLSASLIHPREVFRPAILANASSIILAHTHPSGCPQPSQADLSVTEELARAGRHVSIEILDHVVCAKLGYCSLKQEFPSLFLEAIPTLC